MTNDKYDTHAYWLAFDLETTRLHRRLALQRAVTQLRDNVATAFGVIRDAIKTAFAPIASKNRYTKGA